MVEIASARDETRQQAALDRRRALERDYVEVFGTESGQRVLRDIEASCWALPANPLATDLTGLLDATRVVYRAGAQGVAFRIRDQIARGKDAAPLEAQLRAASALSGER